MIAMCTRLPQYPDRRILLSDFEESRYEVTAWLNKRGGLAVSYPKFVDEDAANGVYAVMRLEYEVLDPSLPVCMVFRGEDRVMLLLSEDEAQKLVPNQSWAWMRSTHGSSYVRLKQFATKEDYHRHLNYWVNRCKI